MAVRPRCPRCGGPVVRGPERPAPQPATGSCVNCGLWFALPTTPGSGDAPSGPLAALPTLLACLAAGLLLGAMLAVLAQFDVLGGVLLVALGLGLVIGVGALQAGYLEGAVARAREPWRRLRPPR